MCVPQRGKGWDGKRLGSGDLKDDVQQGLGSESDTRNQSQWGGRIEVGDGQV